MFGYIIINKGDMKFKEFDIYKSFYCGLCRRLKERYGILGQMSLTYDMTFVIMLLTGLYEEKTAECSCKCVAHPFERHTARSNTFTDYAADMNILLTYYKCNDDWVDDKKYTKKVYGKLLKRGYRNVADKYPAKVRTIEVLMRKLSEKEQQGCADIDEMCKLFGEVMAQVMGYRNDEWKDSLEKMGMYLGKFIYLCDAYEDIEKDVKDNNYNPFYQIYKDPDFEEQARNILVMMMAECSKEFEKLPIIENIEILRNILYSGVWYRYERVKTDRGVLP